MPLSETGAKKKPPQRVSRDDGYGRSTRFYDVEGERYPSVTSILQAIGKPALIAWSAKVEREMCVRAACDLWEDVPLTPPKMSRMAYERTLQERLGHEKAHQKELAKAADIGSQAHEYIEWEMRKDLLEAVGPEPSISDKATWAVMAYEDWAKKANLAPRFVEQTVYSKRYGYAGTCDWCGEIDAPDGEGRIQAIGDFKTGKAIYPEALLQVAAYTHALLEMGQISGYPAGVIVRLPKLESDPEAEIRVIPAESQKALFKVFLSVMDLWSWLDSKPGEQT